MNEANERRLNELTRDITPMNARKYLTSAAILIRTWKFLATSCLILSIFLAYSNVVLRDSYCSKYFEYYNILNSQGNTTILSLCCGIIITLFAWMAGSEDSIKRIAENICATNLVIGKLGGFEINYYHIVIYLPCLGMCGVAVFMPIIEAYHIIYLIRHCRLPSM